MIRVPASLALIDPAVASSPACRRRLERVLPFIDARETRAMTDADYRVARAISSRRHGKDDFGDDAVIVFTTFDSDRLGWYYHVRGGAFQDEGGHCQPALELNIVEGCVFRCAYCGFGRRIIFYLDVERFMVGLDEVFARHPRQSLFKYSNMTDLPPFEPELDAVRPMVERFAREPGRFLMLFTKSDNVDFLLPIKHGGRTIVSWSLSGETISQTVDKRTATMRQRIAAMAKCQSAGYLVRARLSPIVPVKDWRAEYELLFVELFAACRPDVVTLELLGWMDFDDLVRIVPEQMLDAEAVAEARAAAGQIAGQRWRPFTERTHQEIYRFCIETIGRLSPGTPVSICHGTPETWSALGPLVGMSPGEFICNCGGLSTPGQACYERVHGKS